MLPSLFVHHLRSTYCSKIQRSVEEVMHCTTSTSAMNSVETDSDSDSDIAFPAVDFSGVDFDQQPASADSGAATEDVVLLEEPWERRAAIHGDFSAFPCTASNERVSSLAEMMAAGQYLDVLSSSATAHELFANSPLTSSENDTVRNALCQRVITMGQESCLACLELELVGIAALNLFLQCNYTGPSLDKGADQGVNPHSCFASTLQAKDNCSTEADSSADACKNAVLAELSVDGTWPCPVSHNPYFLLLARSILSSLTGAPDWTHRDSSITATSMIDEKSAMRMRSNASCWKGVTLWSARAAVAHERLLQAREPTSTLWDEVEAAFETCQTQLISSPSEQPQEAATVCLEFGLAEHHFDRPKKGKGSFQQAQKHSGLEVEVTGAIGKRTKFQQEATAQMLVRAKSSAVVVVESTPPHSDAAGGSAAQKEGIVKEQLIEHPEDGILLEKIKFDDEKEHEIQELNILDQAILLALCLDVKNSNPADGLTGEEMGAFLARVLDHHDDWMVYSTALLERSWLEFERSHARERSILQMQALADQHTNRLTITQSTRESVESSAPVQERLRYLHRIVYPPRWYMIQDLAERYAALGIVTSAAELFTEIELWDSVVECYRRAGRVAYAEEIVRNRLTISETPRMWAALGDLTKGPAHYERAIELSKGRYSDAYLALGEYHAGKRNLEQAAYNFEKALKVRPLTPAAWFRLGTISMQLSRWETALRAFSEVVLQEPEEADAWANIAAIHMHNKQPSEAYPALNESLKYKRSNWRVWVSKLYTCLDLEKYDEAVQACNVLLDLRAEKQQSEGIPPLEKKCVRAVVGGTLKKFHASRGDEVALDSWRRTLSRVHALLDRMSTGDNPESWVFETMAFLHEQTGQESERILETLMKEYRSLQANAAWEKDNQLVKKICQTVSHIASIHINENSRQSLTKARFVVRGVIQSVRSVRPDDNALPQEFLQLERLLEDVTQKLKENQENQ